MKSKLLLTFFLFSFYFINAQSIQWQKSFGGSADDEANCIKQTMDGGLVVAGFAYSNDGDVTGGHGGSDLWVVKLNTTGNIVWAKTYGGSNNEGAESIQQTSDKGYIVAGYTNSNDGDVENNHGGYDCWVVKLDSNGKKIWAKTYGSGSLDWAYAIQQTTDGGYIMAGYASGNGGDVTGNHSSNDDYWIVKLDNNGNIVWQKCFGGTDMDDAHSVQQTSDGGYIVVGTAYSNNGDVHGQHYTGFISSPDVWVIKLNATGDTLWTKALGGSGVDGGYYVQQTSDGKYIIAAEASSNNGDLTTNK
jgi:hypothetical protein